MTGLEGVSGSEARTRALGAALARALEPGDVVFVSGELGAGKTAFVRGAGAALGVRGHVTSPTFTIGHLYDADVPVAHLDLYRFTALDPAEWGDLEPYFDGTIAFVEWPDAGRAVLPAPRASVSLAHAGGTRRRIRLDAADRALLEEVERADPGVRYRN